MSQAGNCDCPCPDPTITEIPGAPGENGAAGAAGSNGINAFTVTTADITLPASAGPVALPTTVGVSSWAGIGQVIFISDGTNWGHFEVLTIPSAASFTLEWLQYPGDAVGTTVIATGATVSPSGVNSPLSGALPTAFTDNSTGTASNVIAAGAGVETISFPHTFIGGTSAVESVTTYVMPYKFKILSWVFVTEVLLVGAGGSRIANMEIDATDVGTVPSTVTIPIANAAVGTVTAGTTVTGANTGNAGQSFSIEIANGGTQFTAGSGTFVVTVQNMDTADAIASLADHINDLITALT